uniref:Uncharacterized protein n=1 Tax=Gasterosteus aculeatus TaxID=69293 RepID=G3P0G1_GASAC
MTTRTTRMRTGRPPSPAPLLPVLDPACPAAPVPVLSPAAPGAACPASPPPSEAPPPPWMTSGLRTLRSPRGRVGIVVICQKWEHFQVIMQEMEPLFVLQVNLYSNTRPVPSLTETRHSRNLRNVLQIRELHVRVIRRS